MTFRITSIERITLDGHYVWQLKIKGIEGDAIYGRVLTGADGYGLFYRVLLEEPKELLPADRFRAHPGLTAQHVAHRVAACLGCVGWGEEDYDDRESITGGRAAPAIAVQQVGS